MAVTLPRKQLLDRLSWGTVRRPHCVRLQQVDLAPHTAYVPARVPVRWAVALLADSQGVIDLNLPLNGSLNDAMGRAG